MPPADSDLPLNANGFHWPAAFQRAVVAIDLAAAPAVPTLLFPARGDQQAGRTVMAWQVAGAAVTEHRFTYYNG